MDLLRVHYSVLQPELRRSLVQALTLLRTKNLLEQTDMLSLFFYLFRCRDKTLRATLYKYIVTDIKNANLKCKNNKLNRALQNYMFTMISGENHEGAKAGVAGSAEDMAAKYSLDICIELYRKQIWNDAKTVNIIAEACFSPSNKVLVTALQFFLQVNQVDDDEDSDDDVPDMHHMQFRASITKKTKNQKARLERAKKTVKKREKRAHKAEGFNASALHLLQDPQGFAEKLFRRTIKQTAKNEDDANEEGGKITSVREVKFEVRLLVLNLISRIIGIHKLILLNFYPSLIR